MPTARQQLQQRADGPYRGAAAKDLELVEFADFQCPHCKEAQANMDKLATDYPKARIVFQNFPIPSIHPEAMTAAEYGVCVTKLGGSTAFFQFASAVFDGQDGLATADGATLTLNSAVTKAGLDPAKVSACAATPEIKADVDASVKLGDDLGINEVPTLVINGRAVPANAPYDVLKKIIDYQVKADGVAASKKSGELITHLTRWRPVLVSPGRGRCTLLPSLRRLQQTLRATGGRGRKDRVRVVIYCRHELAVDRHRLRRQATHRDER